MPDEPGVEKESKQARRQRVQEERRRRKNEERLEGQRREIERKKSQIAADTVARAKNENGRGASVDQLKGEEEQPQPLREEVLRSDIQKKRLKRKSRRAAIKAAKRASSSPAPAAKNEHPELHVIAQVRLRAHPRRN